MNVKIALRDARKSLADYGIYFVTLTLAIAIFYAFSGAYPQALYLIGATIAEKNMTSLLTLQYSLRIASVLVGLMFGFLILSATNFFYKRKQRQFGLFLILGFPKGKIAIIMTIEILFPALISLFTGLLLGVGISQLLGLFTTSLFSASKTNFAFYFSWDGVLLSAVFFLSAIALSLLLSLFRLNNASLLKVYLGGRKNETEALQKRKKTMMAMLIVSLLLLLLSYGLMIAAFITTSFIVFITGSISAFLFFSAFSTFLFSRAKSDSKHYYNHLNFFVLKQANSHINSNAFSLAFVALTLILTAFLMAMGFGINFGYKGQETVWFGFSYVALYMGLSFVISACAILSIRSLSEATDEKEHYRFLLTIGAEKRQVKKALLKEQALYFVYPLLFALLAIAIGLIGAYKDAWKYLSCDISLGIVISLATILTLYAVYFLITYGLSKQMVFENERK
jgi:putative ABC transport system permease protein